MSGLKLALFGIIVALAAILFHLFAADGLVTDIIGGVFLVFALLGVFSMKE